MGKPRVFVKVFDKMSRLSSSASSCALPVGGGLEA